MDSGYISLRERRELLVRGFGSTDDLPSRIFPTIENFCGRANLPGRISTIIFAAFFFSSLRVGVLGWTRVVWWKEEEEEEEVFFREEI